MECGEDIDKTSEAITADGEEQDRLLEQVKHLESVSVTLRSSQVLAALANFHAHRVANPALALRFRFTTNAGRGRERDSPLPEEMRGLDVWEDIRAEGLQEPLLNTVLAGLRSILHTSRQPDNFPEKSWKSFQTFIKESNDEELVRFIKSCGVEFSND